MSKLIVDATLPEKLRTLTYSVELVDADGRLLGVYRPAIREPQLSAEEWDRIRKEPGGRPLGDILGDQGKPS